MSPIGLIIAGPIADKLGVQTWFIIGGVVTLMMGIASFFVPAVMHFEDGRSTGKPATVDLSIITGIEMVGEQLTETTTPNPIELDYT